MRRVDIHGHGDDCQRLENCIPEKPANGGETDGWRAKRERMNITHFCVDFTIENPRFSRVWKLDGTFVSDGGRGKR
jgi:hypothetical protein